MKKKLLISFILICVIIAVIGFGMINRDNNTNNGTDFANYPTFTVMASSEHNNLVDVDTTFELAASEDTSLELVQACFSITPKVEYEIVEVRKDYYSLNLKEELKADTIYNIEYKTNEAPYKWSFQTEKKFNIVNFYPGESEYVMPSTVIEMEFTYKPNENIEEYFSISPNVEGVFNFDERKIRFIPNEKLKLATTYTIKIAEGYGNTENDEKAPEQSYSFSTTISEKLGNLSDDNKIDFLENKYAFAENQDIYLTAYTYPEINVNNYGIEIYQYKSSEDFINDVIAKEAYGLYPELKPIDLSKLEKIAQETISGDEAIEYNWQKAIPVKSKLAEGYYMVVVSANDINYYLPLQVNNMTAVMEYFDDTLVVWVHDLKTKEPLTNVNIKIDDTVVGITNEDGYCFAQGIKLPEDKNLIMQLYAENRTTMYDIINSHSYNWYTSEGEFINSYMRFDRYTFKPGETLNVWGFIKDRKDRIYKECTLIIKSMDTYANFEEKTLTLDEFGTFETSFDLSNYTSGHYYVTLFLNGTEERSASFEIKDYDTNSYDINLQVDKERVRDGEEVICTLDAKLFDGTPLINKKFNFTISVGNSTTKKEITTDEMGHISIPIDTNCNNRYNTPITASISVVAAGIEDQNSINNHFMIYPHEEQFNVTSTYNSASNDYTIEVKTYDYDFSNIEKEVKEGASINRNGKIIVDKYRKNRVVTSTYYDENTKTMKENYKIERIFEGTEELEFATIDGKATITYLNPYQNDDEGDIELSAYFYSEKDNQEIYQKYIYSYHKYYYDVEAENILMESYHIKYDENSSKYRIGDRIPLVITTKDDEKLSIEPYVLYIIKSANGTEVIATKGATYNLEFKKEYGADICVEGFVFDGICIRKLGSYYYETERRYSVSNDELDIDIKVLFDKEQYKPGETAKIEVRTEADGKPVASAVNLSAVNKEYLAANPYYTNIVSALHNYYNFYIKAETYTHTVITDSFEGGGGGGDGDIRTNFATTAFFETIYTDENGIATFEIKLPDNVTTWNVSVQATTKDYKAAQIDKDLVVTLPFFTTIIMNEKYLVGETPSISIRSNGTSTTMGENVSYDVAITNPNGKITNVNKEAKIGQYVKVSLGELVEGRYSVLVKSKNNDNSDNLQKEFDVVKTFQETTNTEKYNLTKGETITVEKGDGLIYLYNADVEKIFDDLHELENLPDIRNDQKVVSYLAENILRNMQGSKKIAETPDVYTYEGIKLIEDFSEPDLLLTSKIASTGYLENVSEYSLNNILDYFKKHTDNRLDIRENVYAYWGLAALKQPVLNNLIEIEEQLVDENIYEKAVLALAYADIGNYDKANKMFEELYVVANIEEKEIYEYITILSLKLNRPEREELYSNYLKLDRESEYTNFVKLFRIQNEVLNNVKDASITFEINGEEKKIDIKGVSIKTISFTYKDKLTIKKITDNISARIRKTEEIIDDKIIPINVLEKTYTVNGRETNNFNVGDVVKVTIKLDYKELNKLGTIHSYTVEDVLPNCMKYFENEDYNYNRSEVKYPLRKDGQKLFFHVHRISNDAQYITYSAIVTAEGEYISDGTILKSVENNIIDYQKLNNVNVN